MIKFNVMNVKTIKEAQEIGNIFKEFNKGKKYTWLLRSWVEVEAIDSLEKPEKIIYIEDHKGTKKENILKELEKNYKELGGDEAFDGDMLWVPSEKVDVVIIGQKPTSRPMIDTTGKTAITCYKIHTGCLNPAQSFDMVNAVREQYGNLKNQTEIWMPDNLMDIEVIYE